MRRRTAGRHEHSNVRGLFLPIALVLGLLGGGLGATLAALPAAAASHDGSGTLTVSPTSVAVSSVANTLTFTYTAAAGGLSSGEIEVTVPVGWTAPSLTPGTPGYTTSTCGTVASVSGSVIQVTPVTLGGGASCTITYGSGGGVDGAAAPTSATIS